MKKNILNEIDQMKYLFGYKPGKVISEQTNPTGDAKQESQFFTDEMGTTYKFPGITDKVKLYKFTKTIGIPELVRIFAIPNSTFRNYELEKQYAIRDAKGDRKKERDAILGLPLSQFYNGVSKLIHEVAIEGLTTDNQSFENQLKNDEGWENVDYALNNERMSIGIGEGEFFAKLKEIINQRAKEIK